MVDQITANIITNCKTQKLKPVLITIIDENNKMMVRKSMDGNDSDDLAVMMSLAKIKDDKLSNPQDNGCLVVDKQFNTNIGMVLVYGSGSPESDQLLAIEGVAALDFPTIETIPPKKEEKKKTNGMPRTNSEFLMWFNDEQGEPVKVNLAVSNTKVENAVMPRTMSEMFIWNTDENDYPKSNASSKAGSRRGSVADFGDLDEQALEAELARAKAMARSNSKEFFIWNTDENGEEKPRTIAIIPAEAVEGNMNRSPSKGSMTGSTGGGIRGMPRSNSEYYIWDADEEAMKKEARESGVFMTPSGSRASMAASDISDDSPQQNVLPTTGMKRSNSEQQIWQTDEPDAELIKVTIKPTNTNLDNAVLPRSNSGQFIWNTDEDEVEQKIEQQIQRNEMPQLRMSKGDEVMGDDVNGVNGREGQQKNEILMSELESELDDLIQGNKYGNINKRDKDIKIKGNERKNLMYEFEDYMNNYNKDIRNRSQMRN